MAVVFDTHKQHKSLVEAGFTDPQAEATTGVATAVLSVVTTKADLEVVTARLDGIDQRFNDVNKSLTRMNAFMLGQLSATVAGIGIIVGAMFAVVAPHVR
ncbi:MAG: hypothetical protein JO359_00650 [Candidatus Eremiobacteraeota bacterium]|nr:hypothetical protein [Candidatus Eremiobacteraeota bacterium]